MQAGFPEVGQVEERKQVVGFPFYSVSSNGRVYRETKNSRNEIGHEIRGAVDRYGYRYVCLSNGENIIKKKVHHLVLDAFDRERMAGEQCRHLNNVRSDNRIDNLCWGTNQENIDDQERHGTRMFGEAHPRAKLKRCEAEEVYRLAQLGLNQDLIGKMFRISKHSVSSINNKVNWRSLHETAN